MDGPCANVEAPQLLHRVEPRYPDQIRRQGREGQVELKGIVDAEGKVTDLTVRSSPGKPLSEPAVEAVSQWRDKPACCKDLEKPVRVFATFTTTFRLHRK
ncbi:MAG TPA: energy transducer TonB [Thermoanaerobaculia bacterium]